MTGSESGLHCRTMDLGSYREHFLTVRLLPGESPEQMLHRAEEALRLSNGQAVVQDIFGFGQWSMTPGSRALTQVQSRLGKDHRLRGTQIFCLEGLPVTPVTLAGKTVGSVWEDDGARYLRLAGLEGAPDRSQAEQTRACFEAMEAVLAAEGFSFSQVFRTWFYLSDILAWYDTFNRVRDDFFNERSLFERSVPASTGMGAVLPSGAAIQAGLLAVAPKNQAVRLEDVPSPLQCAARDYGSSFSRAMELIRPGLRSLHVSGTASLSADGEVLFKDDLEGQIDKTLEVVEAILVSRELGFQDVTRAVAYFKDPGGTSVFDQVLARRAIPDLPVVGMINPVCREELLFEIEIDCLRRR